VISNKKITVLSELFTNLSAGWFGAIIIFPGIFIVRDVNDVLLKLFINGFFGIISLLVAFKLKQ